MIYRGCMKKSASVFWSRLVPLAFLAQEMRIVDDRGRLRDMGEKSSRCARVWGGNDVWPVRRTCDS